MSDKAAFKLKLPLLKIAASYLEVAEENLTDIDGLQFARDYLQREIDRRIFLAVRAAQSAPVCDEAE